MPAPTHRKSAPKSAPKPEIDKALASPITPVRAPSDSGSFPNPDSKLRADYIRRVTRLGTKLGKRPTQNQLRNLARIRDEHTLRLFGNYAALFRAAGFRAYVREKLAARISPDEILVDIHKAVQRLGHFPTVAEYLKQGGGYSYNLIKKFFGAWWRVRLTLENRSGSDLDWPQCRPVSNSNLAPQSAQLDAAAAASLPPHLIPRLTGISMYPPANDRPVCGTVLHFRAMLHEPTNEQGVVLLFGMMAEELGFIIENVRTAYPDCEAKRRVGKDSWQRIRIEFEYLSSRFNHPEDGCDLIICWRNDRPHPKLEVIALEKVLQDRRKLLLSEAPSLSEVVEESEPTPAPPSPP
jgi:hypothetical protein